MGVQDDYTADVIISRYGQTTHIQGDLQVDEDAVLAADLRVGPAAAAGEIDSGGTAPTPRSIKIGSNTGSDNIKLGRSGKIVDMKADTRLNGKELILDGSYSLSSGSGFVYNATGSESAGESIDLYIGGTKVAYWDSTGPH